MKTKQIHHPMIAFYPSSATVSISRRTIVTVSMALLLCARVDAGTAQASPAALGLPRLYNDTHDGSLLIPKGKFTEDSLADLGTAGTRIGEKRGAKFLVLDAKTEFVRPLRGKPNDALYISFSVYGSPGTLIDIGGARFLIAESIVPGCAQLSVMNANGEWESTGLNVPFDFHDKKVLALMPVLTIRLDPAASTFDLYQSAQLMAADLPLQADKSGHTFTLTAGLDGAQVNGLVQSDENPLYPDANGNAIDDRFEQARKGRLLTATDSKADRKALIAQWRTDQIIHPAPALFVNLPLPDGD